MKINKMVKYGCENNAVSLTDDCEDTVIITLLTTIARTVCYVSKKSSSGLTGC